MVSLSVVPKDAKDTGPYYNYDEQILYFRIEVGVSSLEDEEMVIVEACSRAKRVTMFVSSDPPFPYFYFY